MKALLKNVILVTLFLLAAAQGKGQSRTITYQWLNEPCEENIHCNTGCSACNQPEGTDMVVLGTNAAMIGVSACPHPVVVGDNALAISGWSAQADTDHRVLMSGLALVDVHIDSVVIRHRSEANGPARVVVRVQDLGDGGGAVHDAPVDTEWRTTVLTNCGVVQKPTSDGQAAFQLQLQAYGGDGGDWLLDEVRIVVSPVVDLSTSIGVVTQQQEALNRVGTTDLLGRTTSNVGAGLRFRNGNTIILQ